MSQSEHYAAIHDDYERHYFDDTSLSYRESFLVPLLLGSLDLNGLDVLEIACGSGYNSAIIQRCFPRARLSGLDISAKACAAYSKLMNCPAVQADMTKPLCHSSQYDIIFVVGGLHHCVVDLQTALDNCHNLLRPGGYLLMVEPNSRFILEGIRVFWYRNDNFFDHLNERALDHSALIASQRQRFNCEIINYFGGPAYFLILNSLICRIPLGLKSALKQMLWPLENIYNKLNQPFLFPAFAARWKKI